jgi:hypothetical protein
MKRYCIDTSGFSHPLNTTPEDIYTTLWSSIYTLIQGGVFAATQEIYDELLLVDGGISNIIKDCKSKLVLEVSDPSWDWQTYISVSNQLNSDYHNYISEYNGNLKGTVGLNDISIIALAKTLKIPIVSMESFINTSPTKMRIPNVCSKEGVEHLTFNEFLRKEAINL